tara:strand:- start:1157 stop:1357 length:201 start_codon:yes stop_codon:yes gene_type:complete
MEQLAYALFIMCVAETIPNPHTIDNLTEEQEGLIRAYTVEKCNSRVNYFIGGAESPMCTDWNTECK